MKLHIYGDNIDTDRIIAGKYTKTLDISDLAIHVLEDLDALFSKRVKQNDILIAGWNFGCGSSREQAPVALKACGLQAVIAKSFGGIFYRNAINIGLPLFEIPDHLINKESVLDINIEQSTVFDSTSKNFYQSQKMPPVLVAILRAGGLVPYLQKNGDY